MSKGLINYRFIFFGLLLFFLVLPVYADQPFSGCILSAELVNQDPYPALPGSYVEVLFQLNGIDNNCDGGVAVDLFLEYPFSIADYSSSMRVLESSIYVEQDYDSFWNNVYKLRVDENALEGEYELEFRYKEGTDLNWNTYYSTKTNVKIEDAMVDFELYINNYNIKQRELVFQIINIGNQDVEAMVIEIPPQNNIIVKGPNKNIVGDLDSNEYTSASFEAIPSDGELNIILYYTDSINERRTVEETVYYSSSYFSDSLENIEPGNYYAYIFLAVSLLIIVLLFFKKRTKKKRKIKKFSI